MENAVAQGKPDTLTEAMRRVEAAGSSAVIGSSAGIAAMPQSSEMLAHSVKDIDKMRESIRNRLNKREDERNALERLIEEDYRILGALDDMFSRGVNILNSPAEVSLNTKASYAVDRPRY